MDVHVGKKGSKKVRKKGPSLNRGLVLVIGIVFGFAMALVVLRYGSVRGPAPEIPGPIEKAGPMEQEAPQVGHKPASVARVAILIDDMGGDLRRLQEILELDSPITISVLPHLKHSRDVSRIADMSGRDVLLHLPMEPKNHAVNHPGPGALLTAMSGTAIRKTVLKDLAFVPEAVGVNNHMGSRFTEDEPGMRQVFSILKERGLFFVDSRTTSATVAARLARESGVINAERDVFLDNKRDVEYIDGQIETLVKIAMQEGSAIAIGHPYPETLAALRGMLPLLRERGIDVVPVSELVR